MRRAILLAILLLPVGFVCGREYSGPKCLGPLCLDRKVSIQDCVKMLGKYEHEPCCFYRTRDGSVFLEVGSRETSDELGSISLSVRPKGGVPYEDFYARTVENLRAWKTPEGIGLGSLEQEVLKAYGKPSREEDRKSERHGVRIQERGFFYRGMFGSDIGRAFFGMRNGKITSIELDRSIYAGPDCLGPFCLTYSLRSTSSLFQELGSPPAPSEEPWPQCYRAADGKTFARVDMSDVVPHEPDGVFLSDFPTCMHVPKRFAHTTTANLSQWKTPEGMGLGSSVADVLRAYGKPSSQYKGKLLDCGYIFLYCKPGEKVPDVGDEAFDYGSEGLLRARFGARKGRVSYIELTASE